MPPTDKMSVVGTALESYITAGKQALGLIDVWYGTDEGGIPSTPAVVIEPGTKTRDRIETGHTTLNTFTVDLTVFHARLEAPGVTRMECDERAELLEAYLHQNMRLDGLLIDSYVRSMESGVAQRQRAIMRATRLLWVARTKTRLI